MLATKKALTQQGWTLVFGFPKNEDRIIIQRKTQTEVFEAKMFFGAFGAFSYSVGIAAQNIFTIFNKNAFGMFIAYTLWCFMKYSCNRITDLGGITCKLPS